MGAMKVAAFLQLLELGRTVVVSDVDTVWVADPLSFLYSLETKVVDVAVTSDCLSREADENKDGKNRRFHPNGVWFCGHNPGNTFGATFNTESSCFALPLPRRYSRSGGETCCWRRQMTGTSKTREASTNS